jgi:hypothetical protein
MHEFSNTVDIIYGHIIDLPMSLHHGYNLVQATTKSFFFSFGGTVV